MTHKRLTPEITVSIDGVGGEIKPIIKEGVMVSRAADLDDLSACRTLENSVSDMGWLQNTVASLKPEWFALVLVHNVDPSSMAEDHLKADGVVMHQIGNRATVAYLDM